ncbi:polyhydroxyalkanoic acid system family protein [Afifella pfennigii]|uniref:polyhydroxyalkanoic acid system family protein n=1 Tax=Afifella pfennigii TaxID=209897 RepID=UPI00047D6F83|nr:polyhydroxyalkanoic acid system family protein [Afifella pfennigii]
MSTPVTVHIPHKLGREEAKRRLQSGFGRLREEIAVGRVLQFNEVWEGDRLSFDAATMGQTIAGRIDVFEEVVRVEVDLPWFLGAIAEKLQGRLQKAGTLLLEKK